jgi:hypothetical protein
MVIGYIEEETARNLALGMTPTEAREAAVRRLGNLTRVGEDVYEMDSLPIIEVLCRDVMY